MQSLRQLGIGLIVAIVSVILVVGGIMLSLAESLPAPSTPTQIPPTLPQGFPTPTITASPIQSETATATQTATPLATDTVLSTLVTPTVCTPPVGWIRIIAGTADTIYSIAQRYKTTAENLSAANCLLAAELPAGSALYVPPVPTVTIIACGPPFGWVRTHIVQPGDTLFRIALLYGTTYPQLQRANCMGSSTIIYAGQRLWVPNVPTRTPVPGVTTLPASSTATNTSLPIPTTAEPTATIPPTEAFTVTPPPIPISTNTLTTPSQ
jgi:LysM repeat protein